MDVIPAGAFGDRVRNRLRREQVIWFVTVGDDGTPQPNPVWFLWDGADALTVYNMRTAKRLAHIDARPQVALHFDGDGHGGDIVVLTGTAERSPDTPPPHQNSAYVEKYGGAMAQVSGSLEQFAAEYPVALRIDVRRVRGH
jgi:PPOX class probable F420-dependent enzyme